MKELKIIQIVKCILNIKATSSVMILIPFQIYLIYQIIRKISNIIINGENQTFSTNPEKCGLRRAMNEISKNRNNYKIF